MDNPIHHPATQIDSVATKFFWFAAKVRTRSEELVRDMLSDRGYNSYVAMRRERRSFSDRRKVINVPVFAGYVFCQLDLRSKSRLLSTPGVEYLVTFGGKPAEIPDEEIESIRRVIDGGGQAVTYCPIGQTVCISSGAFAGLQGILSRLGSKDRLIVSLHLLHRSVSVELDQDCVYSTSIPTSTYSAAAGK